MHAYEQRKGDIEQKSNSTERAIGARARKHFAWFWVHCAKIVNTLDPNPLTQFVVFKHKVALTKFSRL